MVSEIGLVYTPESGGLRPVHRQAFELASSQLQKVALLPFFVEL